MNRFILSGLLAVSAYGFLANPSAANAQQTKILTADKHNEYGLVYSLPVTAMEMTFTAKRQVLVAGPYSRYAKKYIGADKVIADNAEIWSITGVDVDYYGAIANDTQYLMQLKPGQTSYIGVDENGMLLSINTEPESPSPSPTVSKPDNEPAITGREYLQFVNEDFISSQSTAKQAQMLAESLMEVREAYISLTRGTADNMPTDGRQLELMLQSLREQELALTRAFTGASYTETYTRTYSFIPEADGSTVVARFSDFMGFVDAGDYSGAPVQVSVAVTAEGELPKDAAGVEKMLPKDAVRYCIPGEARIEISHDSQPLYSHETEFSQFGVVFGLDPKLFTDKKAPSYATFNPVTGGILSIGTLPTER